MDSQQALVKNQKIIASIIVLVVIVILASGVSALNKKSDTKAASAASTLTAADNAAAITKTSNNVSSVPDSTTANPTMSAGTYKDGSYKETGSYNSPGGTDSITISVTVINGVVTDTSATSGSTSRESSEYQSDFIAAYKPKVVGKKLSELKLSRLSGSSLTPIGFNLAIEKIKKDAQA